jgi:hypothetical protein
MLLIVVFVAMILGGIAIGLIRGHDIMDEAISALPVLLGSICLFVALTLLPVIRFGIRQDIAGFNSVRQTIEVARSSGKLTEFERAALTREIAEKNEWLAKTKMLYGNPWIGAYVPKSILELEPIQ